MLTREEDVEIHALQRQGWTITAIARHTGRNRRTIRNYMNGKRDPACANAPRIRSTVRRVRDRAARRGPASVGGHLVRRARRARVHRVVSDPDPEDPGPPAAPGLQGLHGRDGPGERGHRSSAERKPSGIGWICRIHPPAGGGGRWRICWSGRWPIRAGGAGSCGQRWISRTWSRAWTGSPAAWAG